MGLQNELSDVSSDSVVIIAVVLIGKSVRYLNSFLYATLHAVRLFSPQFEPDSSIILLSQQLNLNRTCSYRKRSDDGVDRFGSDCVVCLNRLGKGDHVRELACCHVFHKDCFDGWLEQLNFSCPLCRAPQVTGKRVDRTRRRVVGDLLAWFSLQ